MFLLLLIILGGILLLISIGFSIFWVLVHLVVIVQKAVEPPTIDTNDYSVHQGRDVRDDR